MNDSIVVGLVSDERYFPGLFVTIVSVLLSTKTTKEIHFHVIDNGIQDNSWCRLEQTLKNLSSKVSLFRHKLDLSDFNDLPKWKFGSHGVYARFLFLDLVKAPQIIYLDVDLLFGKDIEELWNIDFKNHVLFSVGDKAFPCESKDEEFSNTMDHDGFFEGKPLCDLYGIPRDAKYFGGGVLKFNVDLWNERKISEKCFEFARKHKGQFKFNDQTMMNFLLWDQSKLLSYEYNNYMWYSGVGFSDELILHYTFDIKPWMYDFGNSGILVLSLYNNLLKRLPLDLKLDSLPFKVFLGLKARKFLIDFPLGSSFLFKAKSYYFFIKGNFSEHRKAKAAAIYFYKIFKNKRKFDFIEKQNKFIEGWSQKLSQLDILLAKANK